MDTLLEQQLGEEYNKLSDKQKNKIKENIVCIRNIARKSLDKMSQEAEIWPKTIVYDNEDSPFIRAEFYKDGTVNVWPRQPLQWVEIKFTFSKDMKTGEFKVVEDTVKELGEKDA